MADTEVFCSNCHGDLKKYSLSIYCICYQLGVYATSWDPSVMDSMFVSPQNSYTETLIHNKMAFGDEAFEDNKI